MLTIIALNCLEQPRSFIVLQYCKYIIGCCWYASSILIHDKSLLNLIVLHNFVDDLQNYVS